MKCPMAPTTLSWWRLTLHLTAVLNCVNAALAENQSPSLEAKHLHSANKHWRQDVPTLNSTSSGTTYDVLRHVLPQRHVRTHPTSQDNASVPQFMRDFYDRYAQNAILQPSFDVIRSFYPQRTEFLEDVSAGPTWVLTFRLTPLKLETVQLAELRIFLKVKDSWQKGSGMIITLLEVKRDRKTGHVRRKRMVNMIKIEGATEKAGISTGRWITMNVTRLARRAFRRRSGDIELAIITSTGPSNYKLVPEIFTEADETSPSLVVYSDEVLTSTFKMGHQYATSWRRWRRRLRNQTSSGIPNRVIFQNSSIRTHNLEFTDNLPSMQTIVAKSRAPRSAQRKRTKTTKTTKQRRRRRGCRRKAMYVRFEDINWHNQIIAPRGYQAFRCVGKCFFPLSDRLSPTKHAIIQTLLHTNHPEAVARPCCVPTVLDPIPILYIDENGVVTYKYSFEGMVARQCGCR